MEEGMKAKTARARTTVDDAEIGKFNGLAREWWDVEGPMAPLHRLNPARLRFIKDTVCAHFERDVAQRDALRELTFLDVGCGAGLVAEPLSRMGAKVTGVDAGADVIAAARAHAAEGGLVIDYRVTTAEDLAKTRARFDVVCALEIVEHVADVDGFCASLGQLVKPGGLLVMSTLNRTVKSFLFGIVGAEYILKVVPQGTHDWKRFLQPGELGEHLRPHGFDVTAVVGLTYNPFTRDFALSARDLSVNYLLAAVKK